MPSNLRDALVEAGFEPPDRTVERELHDEIKRLTKIVRKQGKENRRLSNAYKKLKNEKRQTHEMIAIAEQLQEEIDRLEDSVNFYESDRVQQALDNLKRSRNALSVRYGVLHRALRTLLADSSARELAEEALSNVEDKRWVRAQMPEPDEEAEE